MEFKSFGRINMFFRSYLLQIFTLSYSEYIFHYLEGKIFRDFCVFFLAKSPETKFGIFYL